MRQDHPNKLASRLFLMLMSLLLATTAQAQVTDTLLANQSMAPNQYLQSQNGSHRMYLQGDGNLVVYRQSDGTPLWASNTRNQGGTRLTMQGDGNLVLYTSTNTPVWASNSVGTGGNRAVMRNDGIFAVYNAANLAVWSTEVGTKIAFVGDTNAGANFQNVLNLIKAEGADLTVALGDTVYSSGLENTWDNLVRTTLGNSDPALVVVGNHDVDNGNWSLIGSLGAARLGRQSAVTCTGTYGERSTCRLGNVFLVLSGVGTRGVQADQESFITNSLANAPAGAWRICAWHKNQRLMQVGLKTDEVGWAAYESCRNRGALVMTAHEHSYSRTHLLSNMQSQTIVDSSSPYTLTNGRTIAAVAGIGGLDIRPQSLSGNWWSSIYTSTQGATYGALFGTFYSDRAEFYLKNINGTVIDRYTVLKGY